MSSYRETDETIEFFYEKNQDMLINAMDEMKACLLKPHVPFESDTLPITCILLRG